MNNRTVSYKHHLVERKIKDERDFFNTKIFKFIIQEVRLVLLVRLKIPSLFRNRN